MSNRCPRSAFLLSSFLILLVASCASSLDVARPISEDDHKHDNKQQHLPAQPPPSEHPGADTVHPPSLHPAIKVTTAEHEDDPQREQRHVPRVRDSSQTHTNNTTKTNSDSVDSNIFRTKHASPSDNHIDDLHEADDVQDDTTTDAGSQFNANRINAIEALLSKSRHLHRQIQRLRQENQEASESYQDAIQKLKEVSDSKETAEQSRRQTEQDLADYRRQLPLYGRTLEVLNRQAGAAILQISRLRNRKYSVMHQKARIMDDFRERGLEHWVESSLKGSVSPFVAGAVVEGTADIVEPVLDGIEKLASVNEDLARRMSLRLRGTVPIVEKPFYSGFVTYTVLLFPLVLVISVLMKIKRGIARLTMGHLVILGNFYFGLLSGGCFIATLLGSVDVLQTFRHQNLRMFDFVMVLHGLLYSFHTTLHVVLMGRVRDVSSVKHSGFLLGIGMHFFIHSYRHALRNEDPHVDKRAYAVYTGIFVYILYEQTVKQIRTSLETTAGMKLNNTSITTYDSPTNAGIAVTAHKQGSQMPSRRASFVNLPVFERPTAGRSLSRLQQVAIADKVQPTDVVSTNAASPPLTGSAKEVPPSRVGIDFQSCEGDASSL